MITILIVDDHAIVRRGLKEILTAEADILVAEASNAEEAIELLQHTLCDLIVLDLGLPGRSGLQFLGEIKLRCPDLPVLVLSVFPEQQFAVRTLKAGAAGYLSKDAAPEELITAIRRILSGGKHVSDLVTGILVERETASHSALPHETLSEREFQILCLLGQGKNISTIARELSISVATVSTHRARILRKMGLKSTAELIRYAVQHHLAQ